VQPLDDAVGRGAVALSAEVSISRGAQALHVGLNRQGNRIAQIRSSAPMIAGRIARPPQMRQEVGLPTSGTPQRREGTQ
jgi:hypothetical protein